MGLYDKVSDEGVAEIKALYAKTAGVTKNRRCRVVADRMGIKPSTVQYHVRHDPAFDDGPRDLGAEMDQDIDDGVPVHEAVNRILAKWTDFTMSQREVKWKPKQMIQDRKRGQKTYGVYWL